MEPTQKHFLVGNFQGIEIGDHLCMGRFLLERAEMKGIDASFELKPLPRNRIGSGGYVSYSESKFRNDTDLTEIDN